MKKLTSVAATLVTAATLFTAPAASAQDLSGLLGIDSLASGIIDNADCQTVKAVLIGIDQTTEGTLFTEQTTRSELAHNLQALSGEQPSLSNPLDLAALKYSNQTADKAQKCGIVKADPADNSPFGMSSKIQNYLPFLSNMSSQG